MTKKRVKTTAAKGRSAPVGSQVVPGDHPWGQTQVSIEDWKAAAKAAKDVGKVAGGKMAAALATAGESIATFGHRAKVSFDAARKAFAEAPAGKKVAVEKPTVKKARCKDPRR